MKRILTRMTALVFAAVLCFTMTSCHKQNSVVATAGKYEISSGVYISMMLAADSEGRNKVNEEMEEAGQSTDGINYYKQKIEDKKFSDWVKDRTDELITAYLSALAMYDKYGCKLDDDISSGMDSYIDYLWNNYGYSKYYEPNGVSKESFRTYIEATYKRSAVFDYVYEVGGEKDGQKGVKKETVVKGLNDNFVIADTITASRTDDEGNALSDKDDAALLSTLKSYCKKLNAGSTTFKKVKKAYEKKYGENTSSDTADTSTDEAKPKDSNAVVYGSDETQSPSDYFSDIKELIDEKGFKYAKVLEYDDAYMLVYTQDITKDEYYYDTYNSEVLNILYSDDFDELLQEYAKKNLEIKFNNYEKNYLKPSKIVYPEG